MTKLFLHSYGLRYHYRHKPGFDVFSLIDIAAALGFDGINVSAHLPGYVEISGRERITYGRYDAISITAGYSSTSRPAGRRSPI